MCQIWARPHSTVPLYPRPSQQLWFDMKVFYIRLSASVLNGAHVPESLTLHCLPRNNRSALEINGGRISPSSSAFLTLERSRADEKSEEEIAYVGSDQICTSANLCFEVYMRDQLLISGALSREVADVEVDLENHFKGDPTWTLECSSKLEYSSKGPVHAMCAPPTLDVYVAGRISGLPLILTQTVQMIPTRKRVRHATLDVIPEGIECGDSCSDSSDTGEMGCDEDGCSSVSSFFGSDSDRESHGGYEFELLEEGDDSWFNSGLGFGLGIGLAMSVGVGLLVNSRHMRKLNL